MAFRMTHHSLEVNKFVCGKRKRQEIIIWEGEKTVFSMMGIPLRAPFTLGLLHLVGLLPLQMADSLFGFVGDNYTILIADSAQARSIMVLKQDEDKIFTVDKHKIMGGAGPQGDKTQFIEYIEKNLALYGLRTGIPLTTKEAASFTRLELANALRSDPYQVNILLGGWDKEEGPSLYWIDYLASSHKTPFSAHGYAGYFLLSIFDKYYKPGMNLNEGLELIKTCIEQLKRRFVLNAPSFIAKVVDKDGVRVVPLNF